MTQTDSRRLPWFPVHEDDHAVTNRMVISAYRQLQLLVSYLQLFV
ncbi:MAG: hypothetical protein JWN04_3694 [Myxococcaceae bacterium]|nr:hypothetical protein [Myxococcaceae bacterium]